MEDPSKFVASNNGKGMCWTKCSKYFLVVVTIFFVVSLDVMFHVVWIKTASLEKHVVALEKYNADRDGVENLTDGMETRANKKVLSRQIRQTDGGIRFEPFTPFTIWGLRDCPTVVNDGKTRTQIITARVPSIIAGLYGSQGSLAIGSDISCIATNAGNSFRPVRQSVSNGLNIRPLEFDISGYSSSFSQRGRSSKLFCVRCEVRGVESETFMATSNCPDPGWTKAYDGYLVSPNLSSGTSKSICIHKAPVLFGDFKASDSSTLIPVLSGSGLPSGTSGRLVACVVCVRQTHELLDNSAQAGNSDGSGDSSNDNASGLN